MVNPAVTAFGGNEMHCLRCEELVMAGNIFHCLWRIKQGVWEMQIQYGITLPLKYSVRSWQWPPVCSMVISWYSLDFDFRGWVFCLTVHCCLSITPVGNLDNALEVHEDGADFKNSSSCTCTPLTKPETLLVPSLSLPEPAAGSDVWVWRFVAVSCWVTGAWELGSWHWNSGRDELFHPGCSPWNQGENLRALISIRSYISMPVWN